MKKSNISIRIEPISGLSNKSKHPPIYSGRGWRKFRIYECESIHFTYWTAPCHLPMILFTDILSLTGQFFRNNSCFPFLIFTNEFLKASIQSRRIFYRSPITDYPFTASLRQLIHHLHHLLHILPPGSPAAFFSALDTHSNNLLP